MLTEGDDRDGRAQHSDRRVPGSVKTTPTPETWWGGQHSQRNTSTTACQTARPYASRCVATASMTQVWDLLQSA